jgi:Flp pilus assembly protein TadD
MPQQPVGSGRTAQALRWAALLVLIGLGAYANCLANPFIWDDEAAILTNPTIRQLWPLGPVLTPPVATPVTGRPITNLSFALSYAVSGLNPVGYHAGNLILHLANSLLLFGIVRRTVQALWHKSGEPDRSLGWAWTVAALWTLHPVHTECLNYATQRTELLAGFFLMLTMYCAMRSFLAARAAWWQAAAVLSCAFGIASKETGIVAPVLVWLYDRTFVAGGFREAIRRRTTFYLGLALTWLVLAAQAAVSEYPQVLEFALSGHRPWWVYALIQSHVALHYLRLAVWPHPLVIDYNDWPLAYHALDTVPAASVTGGLMAGTMWALWKRPVLGFFGAWWFLLLAPTTSLLLVNTEPVAERRMYASVIAVVILAVSLGERWLRARARPRWGIDRHAPAAFVAGVLGLCLGLVLLRNLDYRSEISIWRDAVAKRPGNARAHHNLGSALLESGNLSDAAAEYQQAITLSPRYGQALANFGIIQAKLGRLRLALEYMDLALQVGAEVYPDAHEQRGDVLADLGDYEGAASSYRRALEMNPLMAAAHLDLGIVLERLGQLSDAEARFREAIRLEPWNTETHRKLGLLLVRQGRAAEAQPHLARAAPSASRTPSTP